MKPFAFLVLALSFIVSNAEARVCKDISNYLSGGSIGCLTCDDNSVTCPNDYSSYDCNYELGCSGIRATATEFQSSAYHGYRDGNNQSGNGRAHSAIARLDVCWNSGYSSVDNFGSYTTCEEACGSSSNVACSGLTGADACAYRCAEACSYKGWTDCPSN